MRYVQTDSGVYVLRMFIDEEVFSTLLRFAEAKGIQSAQVQAIGAVKDFELGFFRLQKKEYQKTRYSEFAELLSCTGTISWNEQKPFLHLHAAMALSDYRVVGGHLISGIVGVTVEAVVRQFSSNLVREHDEDTGLFLWNLSEAL